MQDELTIGVNDRIARRVRELRAARRLSLAALAQRCGVSRSMISLIERAESSPTAVLLEKLATGLDVPVATLFAVPGPEAGPVARAAEQTPWRDPESGYVRRTVSPAGSVSPIQIAEVSFPAGARVAYETGGRESAVHQQVWVLEGAIEVTVGDERHRLGEGDCLALVLDLPVVYSNPTATTSRYAVVSASEPRARR
jgi:transcriptional regulator with XRE-family HTH domain